MTNTMRSGGLDNWGLATTALTTANQLPYTPDWQVALGVNHTINFGGGSYVRRIPVVLLETWPARGKCMCKLVIVLVNKGSTGYSA